MSFLKDPMLYNHYLEQGGLLSDIYQALSDMNMSAAVLAAIKVMQITQTVPHVMTVEKNSLRSTMYRNEGNSHFTEQHYQIALICYNNALLHAPKGSMELVKAYSNRSALLFKMASYAASTADIETCFKLGCTGDLLKKLKKRKEQCMTLIWQEELKNGMLITGFPLEFFKFNVKRHPKIPCLSADVDVITHSGKKKVVAAKDICVGTVVAVEKAFTTCSLSDKSQLSCYYCQKMTFNLMPCEKCCFALFCSDKCKNLCVKEYHSVECQIMEVLKAIDVGYKFRLTVKTVLKLKTLCKQWSNLIKESENIGTSRLKNSSVNETYDVDNYSSMLSFKENRHFVFGTMYNSCFVYATVIHYLEKISGFFPESPIACLEAKKCLAKLFMTLDLMWPYITEIENAGEEVTEMKIGIELPHHFGQFSFTGKLKHSCDPNLIVLGLDNRVGLVAVRPITKNTELKISYIGHWYAHQYEHMRPKKMYQATLNICDCRICTESWNLVNFYKSNLDNQQLKVFRAWDRKREEMILPQRDPLYYKETCKLLEMFNHLPNTREHWLLFRELRSQIGLCQHAATMNSLIID